LITPGAVAILDPAFVGATTTDSDDSTSELTTVALTPMVSPIEAPTNSPTSAIIEPTRQEQVKVIIEEPTI
jgi:hypothetical protein